MKRTLPLLLIIALFFSSCVKSVLLPTTADGPILGKWKQQSQVAVLYVAGKEVTRKNIPVNANDYTEFRSTGVMASYTYVSANNYNETDGTFQISNNNTTLTMSLLGYTQPYQCAFVDNNTLTLSGSGASTTGLTSYTVSGVTYTADSASLIMTMVRL
jgi:hypothetical protein